MSSQSDYSADEWQLLVDVPMLVGAAVMVIGKSGLGTLKESFALAQQTLGAIKSYPNNQLIQAIVQSRLKDGQKSSIESFSHPMLKLPPEAFKDAVVEKCRAASAVLAAKSSPAETAEYKNWLDEIADKVAHAASEGGVLGFGGTQFSEPERLAINEIQAALRSA
ncbi:MAG: hypothetical protein ACFCUG_10625 [Thiotrichales bacterium]